MTCSSMVGAGALYAQGYRFESGQVNDKEDDLAQLAEQYSDTVPVDSSSLSVITKRMNSSVAERSPVKGRAESSNLSSSSEWSVRLVG